MLGNDLRDQSVNLVTTDLMTKILEILNEWGRENLRKLGWFASDPHSYEWWGGFRDPFEISVSAILVQLSKWETVSKVIIRLREGNVLNPRTLAEAPAEKIKDLIRGIGFYESKSRTLKEFSRLIVERGGWETFISRDLSDIRRDLLSVRGIGYETADTILLFAGNKLVLPVSRLASRVLSRVGFSLPRNYLKAQQILEGSISRSLSKYKLFHAALVSISKKYCRSRKPLCVECPLKTLCRFFEKEFLQSPSLLTRT